MTETELCREVDEHMGDVLEGVAAEALFDHIAGCERCRRHLLWLCAKEGFTPRISYTSDDMVVLQSLVAAGMGVTTIPGLALRAHRLEGITATKIIGADRHVYAATYGQPPDPPATAALLSALAHSTERFGDWQ